MNNFLLRVQRCFVAWSMYNIRTGVNDTFEKTETTTTVTIPQGYYTFSDLKTYLATQDVTIQKTRSNHIELESTVDLDLKTFGPFLGFNKDQVIAKDTKTTSANVAQFTNGLKTIHIHCPSLVDYYQTISHNLLGLYSKSSLLLQLFVDTTTSLNGTFTEFITSQTVQVPCRDYVGAELTFVVESQGHVDDYEIYLTLELE